MKNLSVSSTSNIFKKKNKISKNIKIEIDLQYTDKNFSFSKIKN